MLPTRGQPAFVMEAFALLVLDNKKLPYHNRTSGFITKKPRRLFDFFHSFS